MSSKLSPAAASWRRNLALIALLLAAWLALSLLPTYFARQLQFEFLGWPFSFLMTAYGVPLSYLVLVGLYAYVMNRGERRRGQGD